MSLNFTSSKLTLRQVLELVFVGGIILLHLYFKLFHEQLSIQGDEAYSIFHSQKDLSSFINFLLNDESPLTFYLILGGWIHFFGINILSVKALPILFSIGSALLIYLLAKKRINNVGATIASLLFLFSNLHYDFSHEVRAYSMVSFLTIASFLVYFELLDNPNSKPKLALYACLTALLPYTHYNAIYVPLVQFICLVGLYSRSLQKYKNIYISYLIAFILFLPQLYFLGNVMPDEDFWLAFPDFAMFEYVFMNLSANIKWSKELYFSLLILLILAYSPLRKKVYQSKFNVKHLSILLCWFILPLLINYAVAQFTPIFRLRYVLYASLGFILCLTYCIALLRIPSVVKWSISAFLITIYLINFSPANRNVEDWENVAEIIRQEKGENSAVVLSAAYMFVNFTYYYDRASFEDYTNTIERLKGQDIYLVNSAEQLRSIDELNTYDRILLVLSHHLDVDPDGLILKYFNQSNFIYCEKYGSEIAAKVYEFVRADVSCEDEMELEFEEEKDVMLNCYEWKHSKYLNYHGIKEYYNLTGEKDSNCVNHFDFKSGRIPIGPSNPFSPTIKLPAEGIDKITIEARLENTKYNDAKFVAVLENIDKSHLLNITSYVLRRNEYLLQDVAVDENSEDMTVQFSINLKDRYLKEEFEVIIYLWNYGGENIYLKEMKVGTIKPKSRSPI